VTAAYWLGESFAWMAIGASAYSIWQNVNGNRHGAKVGNLACGVMWILAALANVVAGKTFLASLDFLWAVLTFVAWWMGGGGDDFRKKKKQAQDAVKAVAGKLVVVPAPAPA
jgi:hypothetical protein